MLHRIEWLVPSQNIQPFGKLAAYNKARPRGINTIKEVIKARHISSSLANDPVTNYDSEVYHATACWCAATAWHSGCCLTCSDEGDH